MARLIAATAAMLLLALHHTTAAEVAGLQPGREPAESVLVSALAAGDECQSGQADEDASCATNALQLHGRLQTSPEPDAEAVKHEQTIAGPLKKLSQQVDTAVRNFIFLVAEVGDGDVPAKAAELRTIAEEIRQLVEHLVPEVLKVRDDTTALAIDNRTSEHSKATILQHSLIKMEQYWGFAWPIIVAQVKAATGDKPSVSGRTKDGIEGSLTFLKPNLQLAWNAAAGMQAVVEELTDHERVGESGQNMEKAACANDYAEGLAAITHVYTDLAKAQQSCNREDPDVQQCTNEVVAGLANVADTIEESSSSLWTCFGISWECTELLNSALQSLIKSMLNTLDISANCAEQGRPMSECQEADVFAALSHLSAASGAMQSAALPTSCWVPGSKKFSHHFLNPYAATPAELRPEFSSQATTAELGAGPVAEFSEDTSEALFRISSELDGASKELLDEVVLSMKVGNMSGLVQTANALLDTLGQKVPMFFELVNRTNALNADTSLDRIYNGKAKQAEDALILMMQFTMWNAPTAVYKVTGAEAGFATNHDFIGAVNAKLQKAKQFLGPTLKDAWAGLKMQLPRINALANDEYENKSLSWASCAAGYASALGDLTHMYSVLITTSADCADDDDAIFDAATCESDLLRSFASIQSCVDRSSEMMTSCFDSTHSCLHETSGAGKHLLSTLVNLMTLKLQCKSADDPLAATICDSTAYSALWHLGHAAKHINQAATRCKDKQAETRKSVRLVPSLLQSEVSNVQKGKKQCLLLNDICWVNAQCCTGRCHNARKRCRPIR